eukprot:6129215-Ditylum_brightwellii.AAC.1
MSDTVFRRTPVYLYEEGWHPGPSPLQHPGPVKLSAGCFPYWTMVQWPEKQLSPEDFCTVPQYGFSGQAKGLYIGINT